MRKIVVEGYTTSTAEVVSAVIPDNMAKKGMHSHYILEYENPQRESDT